MMLRIYPANNACSNNYHNLINQTAFHEAGHATSIYLGNKKKQLPPAFFQILIRNATNSTDHLYAQVIDGCLIQNLPIAGLKDIDTLTEQERLNFQCAYEADVINLLVGPLAEAKYVSIRDDEVFSFNLLNSHALNYYGGSSDVEKAYAYLEYFIASNTQREEKMLELFSQAFQFIENPRYWKCILNLAQYILSSKKNILTCEEAIEVIDNCLAENYRLQK